MDSQSNSPIIPLIDMEIILSAVLGELATRSMSFFINKHTTLPAPAPLPAVEVSLKRILLRAQVIVDEAEGRHVTNQGMLRQLSLLRDGIYRGYYVLDAFSYREHHQEYTDKDQQTVSHSWALSKLSYAKPLWLSRSSSSTQTLQQELEEALESLSTMVLDASELIVFLKTYPRLQRQPYSMHLLLDKCIFSRQMEMELVVNFLLHTQPCHSTSRQVFDVLPIIGPAKAGKSTLVAHVCDYEKVRAHFSQIVFLRHGLRGEEDTGTLSDDGCSPRNSSNGRLLVVVEVAEDLDEDVWERLCSLARRRTTSGSKIIVTSRSDKVTKLGTTHALTLKPLSPEAFWYFFKVLAFGSTDPDPHPRLTYLAMEIARALNGSLVGANITASLLRDNFNVHFWCKILLFLRGFVQNHLSKFRQHPADLLKENKPAYFRRMGTTTEDFLVLNQYQTYSSQEELPNITFQDVMYGSIRPSGVFKVVAWKSRIPPYHCYIYTCEIRELHSGVIKRKRSR